MTALTRLAGLPAPAKLNLFLHIVGQRDNGYHLLQSVFMLIDWMDTLDLTRTEDGSISRTEENVDNLPESDLCIRAAHLLQQATGSRFGAHIHLRKQIPVQAGMGGGSSDAATVLQGLNHLWGTGLSSTQLQSIGGQLGADVPFFLLGRNAWVEGIGERLQAIDLPQTRFVIVKPPVGLETAAIFSAPDLQRTTAAVYLHDFEKNQHPFSFGHNDLQPPAIRLCPAIGQAIQWLAGYGLDARMTGSGSAVFAPLPAKMNADILQQGAPKNSIVKICSNLPAHPLLQCVA